MTPSLFLGGRVIARKFFYVCAGMFLIVGALFSPRSCWGQTGGSVVGFVSDTSWAVSELNPDGTPGASVGPAQFVCGSCQPSYCPAGATIFYFHTCVWVADLSAIPGASWIWRPGVTGTTTPADLQGAIFSREFYLPGLPVAGKILVAADDFAEVSINGTVVGSIGSLYDGPTAARAQGSLTKFDLCVFRPIVNTWIGPS